MKKILILNGSSSEIMLILAAQRLGYYVVTTGNDETQIGNKLANEYIKGDFSNEEEISKIVKENDIYAVCGNANDLGVLTSIRVADKFNLPGIRDNIETSKIFHEKDKFKEFVDKYNFLTPKSKMFSDCDEAIKYLLNQTFPKIIKPVDLSAGRGVCKVNDYSSAKKAIINAFNSSKAKRILIEDYLPGRQYDFHTIIINKKVVFWSASNEYSFINPYQVSCLTIPADHNENISQQLINDIERMAKILNIADGPLWLQYRIKDNKAYIIESARRCGGNNMLDILSRGYSFDFAEWYLRLSIGLDYDKFNHPLEHNKCQGYQSIMANKNGVVCSYYISDEIKKHIFKEYYWSKKGDVIDNYLFQRCGIVMFEYDNEVDMKKAVENINESIKVIIE